MGRMQDNLHLSAPGLIHDVCRGLSRGKEESPYMRNYEVVSIFQPDLDETALTAAIEKVTGLGHRIRWINHQS